MVQTNVPELPNYSGGGLPWRWYNSITVLLGGAGVAVLCGECNCIACLWQSRNIILLCISIVLLRSKGGPHARFVNVSELSQCI